MSAIAVNVKPKRRLSVTLLVLSIALGIIGFLASIGGFVSVADQVGYSKTDGEIVSVDWKENKGAKQGTRMRCSPIVEFQVDGQTYTHGPDQYSIFGKNEDCKYESGSAIAVKYNPSNPSEATVSDSTFDWVMGLTGATVAIWFGALNPIRMILRSRRPDPAT